tara:strand:+ start:67114 stop:67494 length:381 start_codon:yes stop_codon:yes gene_type:complete
MKFKELKIGDEFNWDGSYPSKKWKAVKVSIGNYRIIDDDDLFVVGKEEDIYRYVDTVNKEVTLLKDDKPICKNCKYWFDKRTCEKVDDIVKGKNRFEMVAEADDDQGLQCRLRTGPEFGCVHFSNK